MTAGRARGYRYPMINVLAAFGLAAATGLNAYIPVLIVGGRLEKSCGNERPLKDMKLKAGASYGRMLS